jgi:SAM-dependent methyltransferase
MALNMALQLSPVTKTSQTSITTTSPLPAGLSASVQSKICGLLTCKKPESTQRCSQCKVVYYCNSDCQRAAWSSHKPQCKSPSVAAAPNGKDDVKEESNEKLEQCLAEVASLAKFWLGGQPMKLTPELNFATAQEFWSYLAPSLTDVSELAVDFAKSAQPKKESLALDLGCSIGASSITLLNKGWNVRAIDFSDEALKLFADEANKANESWIKTQQLKILLQDVTEFTFPEKYDVVLAHDLFFYINPAKFPSLWMKIFRSIKENSVLIGSFRHTSVLVKDGGNQSPEFIDAALSKMGGTHFKDAKFGFELLEATGYKVEKSLKQGTRDFSVCFGFEFFARKVKSS